jgi:hypothetical protein
VITIGEGLVSKLRADKARAKRHLESMMARGLSREQACALPLEAQSMRRTDGAISHFTRYADDPDAQAIVAAHPDGMPLELVGAYLGVTRERARTLEAQALKKIAALLALDGVRERDVVAWLSRGRPGDGAGDPEPPHLRQGVDGEERQARIAARVDAQEPSEATLAAERAVAVLEATVERLSAAIERCGVIDKIGDYRLEPDDSEIAECRACGGSGDETAEDVDGSYRAECSACGGTGEVRDGQ